MELFEAAREYEGVKFQHQGRYEWGLDCGGLLILSARKVGRYLYDIDGYSRMPDGKTLKDTMDDQLLKVTRTELKPNDILLMRFMGHPQHIAIVTDKGMIHAWEKSGKVVEHRIDDKWRNRIRGVYILG